MKASALFPSIPSDFTLRTATFFPLPFQIRTRKEPSLNSVPARLCLSDLHRETSLDPELCTPTFLFITQDVSDVQVYSLAHGVSVHHHESQQRLEAVSISVPYLEYD